MGNFTTAIFLPKNLEFEDLYESVITEEDICEFEYEIENSILFREAFIPFQETYCEWFFDKNYNNVQVLNDIVNDIGFLPFTPAARSCYGSIYPDFVIKSGDFLVKFNSAKKTQNFEKYIIPVAFVFDSVYYESQCDNKYEMVSPNYDELSIHPSGHINGRKSKIQEGDYSELFLQTLKDNPERLFVMCKCHT